MYSYTSLILASLIMTQSFILADTVSRDIQQADTYITRLQRGIKCYWHRKPCSPEDQKTVNQTIIGALLLITAISIPSTVYYLNTKGHRVTQQIVAAVDSLDVNRVQESIETYNKYYGEQPDIEPLIWHMCNKIARIVQEYFNVGEDLTPEQRLIADPLHSDPQIRKFSQLTNKIKNAIKVTKELTKYGYNPDEKIDYLSETFTLRSRLPKLNLPPGILKELGLADVK